MKRSAEWQPFSRRPSPPRTRRAQGVDRRSSPAAPRTCQKVQPLQASQPLRQRRRSCGSSRPRVAERERAVGAHQRPMPALGIGERRAGLDQAALDQ